MSVEENLELVRRRFDEHPILVDAEDALRAIYAPDAVLHGPGEQFVGIEGIQRAAAITRGAFSNIEMSVVSMTASGEDRVVTQITGRSVHTGEFQGVQPTNKPITVNAMVVSRIEGGKIVEEWRSMTWTPD
jgi:predicted ester cyclase